MSDAPIPAISHVSIGTNDYDKAKAFYSRVLAVLGCKFMMEHDGAAAFGRGYPEFWVQRPYDGGRAAPGNGVHVGFTAASKDEVDRFHREAIAAGAADDGAPGHRHEYGEPYYGCFLRDLDGNKIEATFWDYERAKALGM